MSNEQNKNTMKKPVIVIEGNMDDGQDLVHVWSSVEEALESGRFDYLIDNGYMSEKKLYSYKTIKGLVKAVSYPFYILSQK